MEFRAEATKLFLVPTYLALSYCFYCIIRHLCINCKYCETNPVSKVHNFETVVPLHCMVRAMLFPWINFLYLCFITFLIMTEVPVWVFCVFPWLLDFHLYCSDNLWMTLRWSCSTLLILVSLVFCVPHKLSFYCKAFTF